MSVVNTPPVRSMPLGLQRKSPEYKMTMVACTLPAVGLGKGRRFQCVSSGVAAWLCDLALHCDIACLLRAPLPSTSYEINMLLIAILQYTSKYFLIYLKSALKLCVQWELLVCVSEHLIALIYSSYYRSSKTVVCFGIGSIDSWNFIVILLILVGWPLKPMEEVQKRARLSRTRKQDLPYFIYLVLAATSSGRGSRKWRQYECSLSLFAW